MKLITRLFSFRTRSRSSAQRQGLDRAPGGYALMVMLIAVTVMTIALLAVLPSTYQEARREREEELLFRGNQYAQAIYLFQKKFNRYPNSIKELLHTDNMSFLRKPWPDPMTPGGKWRFIHASGAGALLDSWTSGPALGPSPLGQNGQNGQNGTTGTNPQNGSTSGFGSGQSGSSGFGSSGGPSGSSSLNSGSSFSLGGGSGGGAAGSSSSSSQSDFGWPASGAGSSASGEAGQAGGSWDTTGTSGLPPTGTDLSGTATPGSTTPGSTTAGAGDSINSLSPAALHAEEPGRPLDSNGKPKMSPDCIGGIQQGNSSASPSTSGASTQSSSPSSSSSFSSFTSSSSSSFGSPGSSGTLGSSGSSGFSSSSPSSSSFGSMGSSGTPVGAAVVGVASCSDQASLRTYNKHHRYSEWEFIGVGYNPLGSGASTTPVQSPGQPGQAGSGQQGQGSSFGFGSSGSTNQPGSPGSTGSEPGNTAPPPATPQPAPTPPDNPRQGP